MLLGILALSFNLALATDYCKLCENGTHTMCQFKEGPTESCINYTTLTLTPGEKMYILDVHNDIRNHVASGQESRGALGNQPPAADMFLLEWDEELANIAQRWADQCINVNAIVQHDKCRRTENFEVGQNTVTAITINAQLPEPSVLILNWYKQIMYVIPSDVDDFIGIWRGKHQIGQYTQLVWAKTRFVGCAAAAFKETIRDSKYNIRFVCNYGPAGNIIGHPVYQRGKPCSKCPHRVCDRIRVNLCGGIDKTVDITKQKNIIFKKYKDKITTMSNSIDIENPKLDTRFLNFSILKTPEIVESRANTTLRTEFTDFTLVDSNNLNFTNATNICLNTNDNGSCVEMKEGTESNFITVKATIEENLSNDGVAFTVKEMLDNASLITENKYHLSDNGSCIESKECTESSFITVKATNEENRYDGVASTVKEILDNASLITENKDHLSKSSYSQPLANYSYSISTKWITTNYYNFSTSTSINNSVDYYTNNSFYTVTSDAVSLYMLPNTTLSTKRSEKDDEKNLKFKITFVSTIKRIIDNFFNQSVNREVKKKSSGDKSVIDMTKNQCDRKVKLDNGIILVQDCEGNSKHSVYSNRMRVGVNKIIVRGNEVILPGNRHFKKDKGIWRNGHCRCTQFLQSSAYTLDMTQYLFLIISVVYFV